MAANNTVKTTRIVCISDTHSLYNFPLPPGDILVHAGDFSRSGTLAEVQEFLAYLASLKQYRLKIIIAGNHDLTLEPDFYERNWDRCKGRWRHKKREDYEQIRLLLHNPELIFNHGIMYLEQEEFIDRETGLKFYGR
jgi:3',5'-cyclic AMP phosphodiesterase CpdA